jgi:taurine dioxygenase
MIGVWDNFAVQHYAVNDFWPDFRALARATAMGKWTTGFPVKRGPDREQ